MELSTRRISSNNQGVGSSASLDAIEAVLEESAAGTTPLSTRTGWAPLVLTADGIVKTGAGTLHMLIVSPDCTRVIVYDNTAASGTKLFDSGTIDLTGTAELNVCWPIGPIDAEFAIGCYVDLTGASFVNVYYA